jgi:D-alanyl-D-alanine carboxypeptidase
MEIFRAKTAFGDSSYPLFIKEMNAVVPKLHLKHTRYTNPHGLSDKANHSTANELAQISAYAMKHPLFREIVSTKQHHTRETFLPLARFIKRHRDVTDFPQTYETSDVPFKEFKKGTKYVKYSMRWYNSNRLLTVPGFEGIKTGITQTAGSCLSVYYERKNCKLLTVVLGSKTIEDRWKDTSRITLWAAANLTFDKAQQTPSKKV